MAKAERQKSSSNDKMLEVPAGSHSAIDGERPGVAPAGNGISIEGLGRLSDFPSATAIDNPEEGTGEWCVVLADYLHGATDNDHFLKGHVRRLSRIIPGLTDESVSRNLVMGRIKRLFDIGSIRLATRDEVGQGQIEVTPETESQTVQNERQRRIEIENENALLRERLGIAHDAQIAASPQQASASGEAQRAATGADGSINPPSTGDGEGSEGWDDTEEG